MQLKVIQKNNESILPITFYGKNRNENVLKYHKKVFDFYNISNNYIEFPFHQTGHGDAMQWLINQTINLDIDYYWFCDMDCIPLRSDFVDILYSKIADKETVFGTSQTANHKKFADHIYIGSPCLAFSKKLYLDLGSPLMTDTNERSDTGQEISWLCQEKGKIISYMWPSHHHDLTEEEMKSSGNPKYFKLGNYHKYGLGTSYGNLIFHSFMQSLPRSADLFISKAKSILNQLTGITVCVDYDDFLEETIKFNKKHFDRYIVATHPRDINTINICKRENVEIYLTESFYKDGAKFNKGLVLSEVLRYGNINGWTVIHDADTVLPLDMKSKLDLENMDIQKIYGCDRKFIPTYQDWVDCLSNRLLFHKYDSLPGTACGFMQLFNTNSNAFKNNVNNNIYGSYPTANFCDIHFLYHWCPPPEPKPEKLGLYCYHLTKFHGTAHSGRNNSLSEEFKKNFKEISNV
jgi:hypothetical protein